jgi:hypothetical protein
MTALGEEFVDAFGNPARVADFPPTFETPTLLRETTVINFDAVGSVR